MAPKLGRSPTGKALSSVQRTNGLPMNGYSLVNFSWLPIDAIGCAKSDVLMLEGAPVELLNAVNIWFFIVIGFPRAAWEPKYSALRSRMPQRGQARHPHAARGNEKNI